MQRNKGAFGALVFAGLAYLFKNRKQIGDKVKGLTGGSSVRNQLPSPTRTSTEEPKAYTGDTVRM